ncbi:MAG: hypothetical protein C4334_13920 [Pyrinomonas sp.]|uniref:hypothetical protein n=1 Tax=Pyrinomonas sp. TaxID=2080306 RepID=UPI00332FEF27
MILSKSKYAIAFLIVFGFGVLLAWGAQRLWQQATTTQGQIVAFILDPAGRVEGVALDNGDQVRFGAQTGEFVSSRVKVGDRLTATGRAGTRSGYGREVRATTLQVADQRVEIVPSGPQRPKGPKHGPVPPPVPGAGMILPEGSALEEKATAQGTIKLVLVDGHGQARGLILSDGTQVALPRAVADAGVTLDAQTPVIVEGRAMKSDFGVRVEPARLTIGQRTFSFDR